MKLNQVMDRENFKSNMRVNIGTEYRDAMDYISTNFYITNQNRELRDIYSTELNLQEIIRSYVGMNKQKFRYLIDSANEKFFENENIKTNTQTTNSNNNVIEKNHDFNGAMGAIGGGESNSQATHNQNIKDVNVDKSKYLSNFYSIENNSLMKELANKLFETFEFLEGITW